MAHPNFVDIADTDVDVDSPVKTGLLANYRQCDRAARVLMLSLDIAEVTVTSTSYVTVASRRFLVPNRADFSGIQRSIMPELEVKAPSAQTITVKTTISGVDSDEQSHNTTSYAYKTLTQNIAAGAIGTVVQLDVKAKVSAGTGYVRSIDSATTLLEY